jgi:hypothetical protein
VPVDQAQSLANGHQRAKIPLGRCLSCGLFSKARSNNRNGRFRILSFNLNQPTVAKSSIPKGDAKPSIRFWSNRAPDLSASERALFKEQVDIFPAVFIEPDRIGWACVTQSLFAMEIGSVEGVRQMTKPIRVWAIFSIRFRVIKK